MINTPLVRAFHAELQAIGYSQHLIRDEYSFTDFDGRESLKREVFLAAFSGYPCSYRNACAGVIISDNNNYGADWVQQHRTLGAPLLFEVNGKTIQPWSVGFEKVKPVAQPFSLDTIDRTFKANSIAWSPENLGRVKNVASTNVSQQRDIFDYGVPVLAEFFQRKLKVLLERAFVGTASSYEAIHGETPNPDYLFPYLFRFVTAKVFMDRADAEGWDTLNDPLAILQKAESHSGSGLLKKLPPTFFNKRVLNEAWLSISQTLNFDNLSVRDLVSIYEELFINAESRRKLGIHSTPIGLADYVVEHLPWERIPIEERRVFEPFCGHGIFLAHVIERLGRDLNPSLTPQQRHAYFRRMLVGVEIDPLALEVCRLILTYADYPNGNNWDLHRADVFTWSDWNKTLKSASVVLANPPYEAFSSEDKLRIGARKSQPPAEMLYRLLRQPPAMMGLVLPQSFLSSPFYQEANQQIAEFYEQVSIVELPPIFRYADNETIALLASGRRKSGTQVSVRYAEVQTTAIENFLQDSKVSNERSAELDIEVKAKSFSLWLPPEGSIFSEGFRELPTLGSLADIRQGLHWVARNDGKKRTAPRTDVVTDVPTLDFMKGAEKSGSLSQFMLSELRYLSLRDEDQYDRTRANAYPWDKPKVVCNYLRFQRKSPWRIAAWADREGLAFSKSYIAIWPHNIISEFALSAILCSPFANAFSFERDLDRCNHISTLQALPLPKIEHLTPGGLLHEKAEKLQMLLKRDPFTVAPSQDEVEEALFRMDAAVLDSYELPARIQRYLLDIFKDSKRPVNISFDRYFPDHFTDAITLTDYVAIKYDWDSHDDRRCELIEKDVERKSLTSEEESELHSLEELADLRIQLDNPNPFAELDSFIEKLKTEGQWKDSI